MTGLKPDGLEMAEAITDAMRQGGTEPERHRLHQRARLGHQAERPPRDRGVQALARRSRVQVPISSIKSMIGHSLGGIGAIEMAACALAIDRGVAPPTAN